MKRIALALATLLVAISTFAAELPPGKWWRRPEIVRDLSLTDDQQTRLEQTFRTSAEDLIDLRGNVEKQNIALRGELDQPQLDRNRIRAAAARLSEARGKLFERELMLLVDMRSVLTADQWNRMRARLEQQRPVREDARNANRRPRR